jgi:hypothetical protein
MLGEGKARVVSYDLVGHRDPYCHSGTRHPIGRRASWIPTFEAAEPSPGSDI